MDIENEVKIAEVEQRLSVSKKNYRETFENVLHKLQRRWKKAGVRFDFSVEGQIDKAPPTHEDVFRLDKGVYGRVPDSGRKRRGWTIYWHTLDGPRPADEWPLEVIRRFMDIFDDFMDAYKDAVDSELEEWKGKAEEMEIRFGLGKNISLPVHPVSCQYCDWAGKSDDDHWQQGVCPRCGEVQGSQITLFTVIITETI